MLFTTPISCARPAREPVPAGIGDEKWPSTIFHDPSACRSCTVEYQALSALNAGLPFASFASSAKRSTVYAMPPRPLITRSELLNVTTFISWASGLM